MQDASMLVRIRGNIDELKKSLADGKASIDGVSVKMREIGQKTNGDIQRSYQQIDKTLSTLGINVGNNVAPALDELASASGKTASQMGLIATAGLVASAALAGWNLGRKISELGDFDKKIG